MTAEYYFTPEPGSEERRQVVRFTAAGREFRLVTGGGVFSSGRLDPGTAVLLRKAALPDNRTPCTLLDLGCGYGPIATFLAACSPLSTVYAVDVNNRALALTRDNIATVRNHNVVVSVPGDVDAAVRFDQIWSNPPIRIGKAELHGLLDRWLPRLTPTGAAWLVVARHLGADSLHAWLTGRGWAVQKHASQKGYRVLRVTHPPAAGNPDDSLAGTAQND